MKPIDYVIALLDADPHGWEVGGTYLLVHTKSQLVIKAADFVLEVRGDINLTWSEIGFFGRRRLRKALARQKAATLAQKLLDTCESM